MLTTLRRARAGHHHLGIERADRLLAGRPDRAEALDRPHRDFDRALANGRI